MTDKKLEALDKIIREKHIRTVFQPIISLMNGSVLGHEALSRITCDCEIKDIDMLFEVAGNYSKLWDLEQLCRTTALEAAFVFMIPPYSKKIFLNVNPNIMHEENFIKGFTKEFLKEYNIKPNNVIFEITERNVIVDMKGFMATIDHYRGQDYKIAIDDVGAGYSGLNLIKDINPNYIKLDMNLIRGVDKDGLKYALVKGMAELSKISNIYLIAEGVETYEELEILVNLGVQYGQGYYIQKPEPDIKAISSEVVETIKELNLRKSSALNLGTSNAVIKNLCTPAHTLPPDEKIINACSLFKQNQDTAGVCIVEDDIPVGIIAKDKLEIILNGKYGIDLRESAVVCQVMDRDFLAVDCKTAVNIICARAMARMNDKIYDLIVVTENGKYIGTVTVKDLLQKVSEIMLSLAKSHNPQKAYEKEKRSRAIP